MGSDRGPQPSVAGERVLLRPWTMADVDTVFTACQDSQIQRWTPVPSPYSKADAVDYVDQIAPQAWRDGGAVFAVTDAATREVVGSMGAHALLEGVAHVGYWAVAAARGQGFTSDALRTVTSWFLREGEAVRVELVVEPANTASIRVAEAAGYTREGLLRQRFRLRTRQIDVVMYSMIAGDDGRLTVTPR